MANETVELAEGEPEQPKLPKDRPSAKKVARDAVVGGMEAVGSFGPVRRAARWVYFSTLGLVWRRHRRKEDSKYGG